MFAWNLPIFVRYLPKPGLELLAHQFYYCAILVACLCSVEKKIGPVLDREAFFPGTDFDLFFVMLFACRR